MDWKIEGKYTTSFMVNTGFYLRRKEIIGCSAGCEGVLSGFGDDTEGGESAKYAACFT